LKIEYFKIQIQSFISRFRLISTDILNTLKGYHTNNPG